MELWFENWRQSVQDTQGWHLFALVVACWAGLILDDALEDFRRWYDRFDEWFD